MSRLARVLVPVGLAVFVFLVLVIAQQVDPVPAAVALLVICLGSVLLIPAQRELDAPASAAAGGEDAAELMMRRFADALSDPCLILDGRSMVLHRNDAARQLFPDLLLGRPLAFWLRHPHIVAAVETVQRTGQAQSVQLHQTVPTETWHRVSLAPLQLPSRPTGEGGASLIVLTLQDFTELKRVDILRQDFVANISHELRTPLTSLLGFVDTLLGPAAKDEAVREKFLTIMRGQAERMRRLVEDLLSLSRIEMRQHQRPTGRVNLSLLLGEVVESLRGVATEAGVTIAAELPEGPAEVAGDREELFEVVQNLLDNAVKYGGAGGRVDLKLVPAPEGTGFVYLLSVTDHGPGVAPEHVPRLTERFYRVEVESSRKKKGTGLGLAIVKHIVARHRGQLSIRSRPGEGMRVEVLLRR